MIPSDLTLRARAHKLGVTVIITPDLRDGSGESIVGLAEVATMTVWLDSSQTEPEMRCTFAHELVHLERRHVPTGDPVADAAMEDEADALAALLLISDEQLEYAETIGRDISQVAEILGVDPNTLAARRRIADRQMAMAA